MGAIALLGGALGLAFSEGSEGANWIRIARQGVLAEAGVSSAPIPTDSSPAQPVFVTIEVNGVVRGCRGDLVARTRTLGEEIELAARGAAKHDPRYRPLSKDELKSFLVTVTLVDSVQPLSNVEGLEPKDGLVLTSGGRTGIVLPWEGKDPAVRLKWAYRKAGVAEGSSVTLEKLIARRFRG